MTSTLINVVQNDNNYDLNFLLTDANEAVVDLTGATLKFKAQLISELIVQFSGNMVVTSALTGACKYNVQATNFEVAGTYNCQIEVTYTSTGEVITFAGIQVVSTPKVPQS